jgi:hypothetical protein
MNQLHLMQCNYLTIPEGNLLQRHYFYRLAVATLGDGFLLVVSRAI